MLICIWAGLDEDIGWTPSSAANPCNLLLSAKLWTDIWIPIRRAVVEELHVPIEGLFPEHATPVVNHAEVSFMNMLNRIPYFPTIGMESSGFGRLSSLHLRWSAHQVPGPQLLASLLEGALDGASLHQESCHNVPASTCTVSGNNCTHLWILETI